ncbi:transglycosylase SLT domain-containing protein [Nocardia anaemiae]|uniref:transglycosylase SLT domain-containing protein n=1 Tax=Nocardia anaemiae TaxID=263910 RepID=UPI001FE1E0A1|nr:transglycosylase SLT domain-containing protein [Nocardia anaemiae]
MAKWEPEHLTTAANNALEISTNLDAAIRKGTEDTAKLGTDKVWSGAAAAAANTRMGTEQTRASEVSTRLHELQTAFQAEVGRLRYLKDEIVKLRNTIQTASPVPADGKGLITGFAVNPDGTIDPAARIAELLGPLSGQDNQNADTQNLTIRAQTDAANWSNQITLKLKEAEQAANDAKTKVDTAVQNLEKAFGNLGDPNAIASQPQNTSTTPATTTNSNTSKPSYVTSSHHGSGSGSSSGTSNYGTTGGTHNATGPMPTGDVAEWIKKAKAKLIEMGYSPDQIDERALAMIIEHESGGNPLIVNDWDSNAAAGHPSKGLMQTIDSTFNAYKAPGHDNIYDPVDNIIAGTRYAIDRYGSLSNVPGVAAVNSGGAYQGY